MFISGINAAEVAQRNRAFRPLHRVARSVGTMPVLNVIPPPEDVVSPLPTAAAYGFESTMMERLQAALASPFSPGTFVRSMSTSTEDGVDTAPTVKPRTASMTAQNVSKVRALKTRPRKHRPTPLSLRQPNRLSVSSPLSPFHFGTVAARLAIISSEICPSHPTLLTSLYFCNRSHSASITPISPTAFIQVSPLTKLARITENQIQNQKMEKLARCLGENIPQEIVYPSFGQVGQEADKVDSFLDLYRKRTVDDMEFLNLKSPAPRVNKQDWACFDEVDLVEVDAGKTRKKMLRRSRSLGSLEDFYSAVEILDLKSPHMLASAHQVDHRPSPLSPAQQVTAAGDISPLLTSPIPNIFEEIDIKVARKKSIANAKATILGADAVRMAHFRRDFRRRRPPPLNLTFGPRRPVRNASMITPYPATPSPLVAVKSPRAPYWVQPFKVVPKTPRTLRTERRQGWGGPWNFWSIGEIMDRSKAA
ncbi:hypothetical protein NLI96_g9538 [Meripilus lineatus]|uniref:Uncharacterized protein n=1 Tax=Meripilus lineatus TaxID=2056292 RepID=A0AAD5UZU9_9APHY|nr:hypothetical protein NLI96_g9538 [Physisporinus lineatus]